MGLLPLDEASRRLRVTARSYLGVHEIPVKQIIGSVDRSKDLNRDFNPRHGLSARRLENLRTAFPDGDAPAIDVFEIGGAYFVEDGHHRVALALERHAEFIDAQVTRLETNYQVGPDADDSVEPGGHAGVQGAAGEGVQAAGRGAAAHRCDAAGR